MITKNIWIMNHYRNAVCAIVATLAATAAMAQSAIEAVTGTMQGGAEVVRVELSQPLAAVPTGLHDVDGLQIPLIHIDDRPPH